jgi:hypothetical protein
MIHARSDLMIHARSYNFIVHVGTRSEKSVIRLSIGNSMGDFTIICSLKYFRVVHHED